MSDRINQEPPVLGRRTNQGSHRVVRAAGVHSSANTRVSNVSEDNFPESVDVASSAVDNRADNRAAEDQKQNSRRTRERAAGRQNSAQSSSQPSSQASSRRQNAEQETSDAEEKAMRTRRRRSVNDNADQISSGSAQPRQEQSSQEQSREEATSRSARSRRGSYQRSAQAERIARDLFVDQGITLPEERDSRDERVDSETTETASGKSRGTQRQPEERVRTRKRASRADNASREESSRDEATTEFSSRRRVAAASFAALSSSDVDKSAGNWASNSSEPREQESEASRTRRARSAVSQMLEFSSSDSTHDTAQTSEQFGVRANPMMSLLFQAPVIPERSEHSENSEHGNSRRRSDNAFDTSADDEQNSRRNRRDKTKNMDALDTIAQALDETERNRRSESEDNSNNTNESDNSSRRNRRNRKNASGKDERIRQRTHRNERAERNEDNDADEERNSDNSSRRNRRLNAQERRAAAEVELIENDLEFDDITYDPIEVDEDFENDSDVERDNSADDDRDERDESDERARRRSHRSRKSIMNDDDSDEEFTTRRRRRRHSKNPDDDTQDNSANSSRDDREPREAPATPLRSRKQQYIDEITDIAGSTRLEAKRQRRRDNRRDRNRQAALITEQDFLARREVVNRIMVVRERGTHTQVSVIEDDVLVEHYISDIAEISAVGNIYQGRVQNVLPSMEAAFVDIGQMRNGVLYAGEVNWDMTRLEGQPRRIEHAFKSGDPVLVQVTKDPIGHKGARLTSQVTLAGRFLVLVPSGGMTGVSRKLPERERARLKSIVSKVVPEEMGVIIRTAAEGASEEAIVKDLEHLKNQWEHISQQLEELKNSKKPHLLQGEPDVVIRVIRDIFNDDFKKLVVEGENVYGRIREYIESAAPDLLDRVEQWDPAEHQGKDVFDRWQIDSQLRKGMERQVYLPSGGSLVIDRTEAMTTIDVNTGRFIGKGKSLEETVTRCNLEAAEEVVRQLRLRDIGGMVMIDFVDMVMPANRDLVLRRLVECLSRDRTKHQVAEVTSLGLVQMTRKRVGQGLVEAFSEECPTCGGRGFILHDEPTVSAQYDDPYAVKGGDPFVKTNKHTYTNHAPAKTYKESAPAREEIPGTTDAVKHSMAAIAAAGNSGTSGNSGVDGSADRQVENNAENAENSAANASEVSAGEVNASEAKTSEVNANETADAVATAEATSENAATAEIVVESANSEETAPTSESNE